MALTLLAVLVTYLVGAIPVGLVVARARGGVDARGGMLGARREA